jgi:hypothetical protein
MIETGETSLSCRAVIHATYCPMAPGLRLASPWYIKVKG